MLGSKVQWSSVYAWDKYPVHHTTCRNTRQQLTKICHKNKSWRQSLQLQQLSDTSDLEFKLYGSFDGSASNVCFSEIWRDCGSQIHSSQVQMLQSVAYDTARNADGAPKQQLQSTRGSGVLNVQNNLIFFASPQKKEKKRLNKQSEVMAAVRFDCSDGEP